SGPTAGTPKVIQGAPKDTSKVDQGTSKGRLTEEAPKGRLKLTAPDLVEVRAGWSHQMKVTLDRENVTGPVTVMPRTQPPGIRIAPVTLKDGEVEARVGIEAEAAAGDAEHLVTLVAVAGDVKAEWVVKVRVLRNLPKLKGM